MTSSNDSKVSSGKQHEPKQEYHFENFPVSTTRILKKVYNCHYYHHHQYHQYHHSHYQPQQCHHHNSHYQYQHHCWHHVHHHHHIHIVLTIPTITTTTTLQSSISTLQLYNHHGQNTIHSHDHRQDHQYQYLYQHHIFCLCNSYHLQICNITNIKTGLFSKTCHQYKNCQANK